MKSERTAELETREKDMLAALDGLRKELYASRQDDAGIHVGDLVKHVSRGKEYIFKVSSINFWSSTSQSLEGRKQLKDGSFGVAQQYIGDRWERVPLPPITANGVQL